MRAALALAVLATPFMLAAAPSPDPAPGWGAGEVPGHAGIEGRIVALSNAARAAAGLPALRPDDRLRAAARKHAAEMRALGYFSHVSPVASHASAGDRALLAGFVWRSVGENIYQAEGLDPRDEPRAARLAVEGWLGSPSHRANLLAPDHTRLGVGVVVGKRGFHAVQVLGDPVP